MKKAEGLSISVVVIAAVAIIVLVILVLIFSGRMSFFKEAVSSCPPGTTDKPEGSLIEGSCTAGSVNLPVAVIYKDVGGAKTKFYCCPG